MNNFIYTIGHSTLSIENFINHLSVYEINCIVDVRSTPYSKHAPQFNKEALIISLSDNHIKYLHMGEEFGARREDDCEYDENNQVDFEKVANSESFKRGVSRLKDGVDKFNICLMCSEGNPTQCHRFSLVAINLVKNGFNVKHILKNGDCKAHQELENDLKKSSLFKPSLFDENPSIYKQLGKSVAYQRH